MVQVISQQVLMFKQLLCRVRLEIGVVAVLVQLVL